MFSRNSEATHFREAIFEGDNFYTCFFALGRVEIGVTQTLRHFRSITNEAPREACPWTRSCVEGALAEEASICTTLGICFDEIAKGEPRGD